MPDSRKKSLEEGSNVQSWNSHFDHWGLGRSKWGGTKKNQTDRRSSAFSQRDKKLHTHATRVRLKCADTPGKGLYFFDINLVEATS